MIMRAIELTAEEQAFFDVWAVIYCTVVLGVLAIIGIAILVLFLRGLWTWFKDKGKIHEL